MVRPTCFRTAPCLATGVAFDALAQRLPPGAVGQSGWVDCLSAAAVLLALIALLLLWRQRRVGHALDHERQLRAGERALRASAEQALLDTHARLCGVVAQQATVKEHERRRIGADIHDDLGQNLLALKMDITTLQANSTLAPPALQQKLVMIAHNLDLTIRSMRCIINDLRPPGLEAGLQAALEWQVAEFSRLSQIPCQFEPGGGVFEHGALRGHDAVLLRVVQEGLANVARHADATQVRLALWCASDALHLSLSDNGVGMALAARLQGCGLGAMRERAAGAGGVLAIASRPGGGTVIDLTLPLCPA